MTAASLGDTCRAVLALDVGGSGIRGRYAPTSPAADTRPETGIELTLRSAVSATSLDHTLSHALTEALAALPPRTSLAAVSIGSRGVGSLLPDPAATASRLASMAGAPLALAADSVTAHFGVLDGEPGAVVAVGTGLIALGVDRAGAMKRAAGWGYLYDDLGSGYWIGAQGLSRAVQHHDGITPPRATDAGPLHTQATARWGAPSDWPAHFYPHDDRAARVASFARDVASLAEAGDPASTAIIEDAADHAARALAACITDNTPPRLGMTGGVTGTAVYRCALQRSIRSLLPSATWAARTPGTGSTPLDGALRLSFRMLRSDLTDQPGLVYTARP